MFGVLYWELTNCFSFSFLFTSKLNSRLSFPCQEEDVKVKEEEEPAPVSQLAHSSTLEQEVLLALFYVF